MEKKLYKCRARLKDDIGNLEVHYDQFNVIGETKEFYLIKSLKGSKKVSKHSKNGYAFDTKAKALFNFLKRRERYSVFLKHFVSQNKLLIESVKELVAESEVKP